MPTIEISEKTQIALDELSEKYGVSATELLSCAIEMTNTINHEDVKGPNAVETLIAFQMSVLGCAGNMIKNMNAAKMTFEAHPVCITIEDMESSDYIEKQGIENSQHDTTSIKPS